MNLNPTDPLLLTKQAGAEEPGFEAGLEIPVPAGSAKEEAKPRRDTIYGSFMIDESEFALPVAVVQEVVNEPDDISPVPLSPSFMPGLFNLRGKIIPIVDLRQLLEFPETAKTSGRKVAIIEHGAHSIGLLFDRTSEVLSEKDAARVDFRPNNRGIKDLVIEGVLKFDDGERLVQVLDPYELLNLDKLPRADHKTEQKTATVSRGNRRTCISFQTGHTSCAIDLRYVQEVREMPKVDQSLFAHDCILGTSNLRGVILPVIDFRGFLGDEAVFALGATISKDRRMLVIETPAGPVGLMVYSIDSILPYFEDEVLPFAKLALPRSDLVDGCLIDDSNRIVMMLDPVKLRQEPRFIEAAKACQEIYPPDTVRDEESKLASSAARRTFIQFSFEKRFALDTEHVSEVINRPQELLEPPFSLSFVEGIVNLRGELITLLNPRLLYGLPACKSEDQKVLIFRHNDQKFGILVDSVDEIVMTTEASVRDLKPMDQQGTAKSITDDVIGCLQHTALNGSSVSVLVLDAGALIERCLSAAQAAPAGT